jgi:hypothetical protein
MGNRKPRLFENEPMLRLLAIFDTAGEVLEALVGCLGVVTVSHRNMEVYHAAPDADWTYPP